MAESFQQQHAEGSLGVVFLNIAVGKIVDGVNMNEGGLKILSE